jgi:hypothetical protein
MPRSARLDAPGVLHDVMGRGVERRKKFLEDLEEGLSSGWKPELVGGRVDSEFRRVAISACHAEAG